MNQAIYEMLKRVAAEGRTTSYAEVAPLAGLDMSRADHRNRISVLLDEISSQEHAAGRPLLSAVVVHGAGDNAGAPGKGFITLAKRLGLHGGGDDTAFFARELTRVHDYWRAAKRSDA